MDGPGGNLEILPASDELSAGGEQFDVARLCRVRFLPPRAVLFWGYFVVVYFGDRSGK